MRPPVRSGRRVAAALGALAALLPLPAAAECKLALALALDISASVDNAEYALQFQGLAAAIEHPLVIDAILTPEGEHIEVAVFEWSGYTQQDIVIGWTTLDSAEAVRAFAWRLRTHPRPQGYLATAIGKAVEFGAALLRTAPPCRRQVLDVSGDGINNIGVPPPYFQERGDLEGIVVNGLVILGAEPDPLPYYQEEVIFGPEAFVIAAEDYTDYERAMREKLIREIRPLLILGER